MRREAVVTILVVILAAGCGSDSDAPTERSEASLVDRDVAAACARLVKGGFRPIAKDRDARFLGKVQEDTARCRGGQQAVALRQTPWVDWGNYWATGDSGTLARDVEFLDHLDRNGRGIDGALIDLEYQRVELIKFNLFDNLTYADYVSGRDGIDGPALDTWPELRLPPGHPDYDAVGGDGEQVCRGELIRYRTLSGICNDIENPLMGSTGTLFARNVTFESTFPRSSDDEIARNRHGDRLGLLTPDPQVISRSLFTRPQREPDRCNAGLGLPDGDKAARCDYTAAPFFNVLAAFWIQFMTHDWFSHLDEGRNSPEMMDVGCRSALGPDGRPVPLSEQAVQRLGCRPDDRMERALVAQDDPPSTLDTGGQPRLARAPRTFANSVTAWWDASQIYGYDEVSRARVKRDPDDRARLLLVGRDGMAASTLTDGSLPVFESCAGDDGNCVPDPVNPAWAGQEATAFPDNFTIGLSFFHNVFAREHNAFVEAYRLEAERDPAADSGLRDPVDPAAVIAYGDVSDDHLFEVALLVVAMEIAKIHTI